MHHEGFQQITGYMQMLSYPVAIATDMFQTTGVSVKKDNPPKGILIIEFLSPTF